jgi:hypothetical protein
MSTWASSNFQLPCRAWTIVDRYGRMVINPVAVRERAERLAGENINATYHKAKALGYRVIQIEMREIEG